MYYNLNNELQLAIKLLSACIMYMYILKSYSYIIIINYIYVLEFPLNLVSNIVCWWKLSIVARYCYSCIAIYTCMHEHLYLYSYCPCTCM